MPIIQDTTRCCEISMCLPKTGDFFSHLLNKIFSHNIQIYKIENDNIIRLKKSYIMCKIPLLKKLFNINGDFFCIINNKHGLHKTIFKDTNIIEIIKLQNTLNIPNKTDNLYNGKILESIKLIYDDNTNFDFTKYLVNIDKSLNLTLKQLLFYHKISYTSTDKIYIKFTDFTTFNEIEIIHPLIKYYNLNINELIT